MIDLASQRISALLEITLMPRSSPHERLQRRMRARQEPAVVPVPASPTPPRIYQKECIPCAKSTIAVLSGLMERMAYDNKQSVPLVVPKNLDLLGENALVALERRFQRKCVKITGMLDSFGSTFWDAECYGLVLEVCEPSVFQEEILHRIVVSPQGWIRSVQIWEATDPSSKTGVSEHGPVGRQSPALASLGHILASYFNQAMTTSLLSKHPEYPMTENVGYLETYMQFNDVPEDFDEMVEHIRARVGLLPIAQTDQEILRKRIELCLGFRDLCAQFGIIVDQIIKSIQLRCRRRIRKDVTRANRLRCIAETLNSMLHTIYAAMFYNLFGLAKPVMFAYRFEDGPIRMIGQYFSPSFQITMRGGSSPISSHQILSVMSPSENEIVCITYGVDPRAASVHQFPLTVPCQEAVQKANQILLYSSAVLDAAKQLVFAAP